jgi:2C-methyl-D-erythritol 2,4-cyclodiphosphate synthase
VDIARKRKVDIPLFYARGYAVSNYRSTTLANRGKFKPVKMRMLSNVLTALHIEFARLIERKIAKRKRLIKMCVVNMKSSHNTILYVLFVKVNCFPNSKLNKNAYLG